MKTLYSICLLLLTSVISQAQTAEKEYLLVKESNYFWDTKIDSALEYSVINASRIVVFNNTLPISKNTGKEINFVATNEKGEKKNINGRIIETANYNGEEKYVVEMTFDYMRIEKKVKVILADLSASEFKLIAGKNWSK